jgi:hypothetical protein
VVGGGVRGKHRHDVATELLAYGLDHLLGTRLVEPGIHEHNLLVVVDKHPDINAARYDPDAIRKWYQDSQAIFPSLPSDFRAAATILALREGT